jgi:predicted oxidoreductase
MKTIKVGSILEATQIAYGCMEIGGDWTSAPLTDTTKKKAVATIRAVLDAGISFFDHADIQPVIGTTNVERIEACCQADGVVLTREEWYQR